MHLTECFLALATIFRDAAFTLFLEPFGRPLRFLVTTTSLQI